MYTQHLLELLVSGRDHAALLPRLPDDVCDSETEDEHGDEQDENPGDICVRHSTASA